jgi:hypothetical protein
MRKLNAVSLYFSAALIAGITATPANAQSIADTSNILVDPNAPPNASLSVQQDEFITSVKDRLNWRDFNEIARSAHITVLSFDEYITKPIADWTQRDFKNFDKEARRYDKYLNELHTGYLFGMLFGADGGSDGEGDE